MLKTIRPRVTYANVISTLALFLALSAGAYALSRNSVKSKHIAPGAVKLADTATSLRLKCPAGTRFLEGACIERVSRPPATFADAEDACIDAGRRLPSMSEGAAMAYEPGFAITTNGEWTHARFQYNVGGVNIHVAFIVDDSPAGRLSHQTVGSSMGFRCVAPPLR
ncbi:MAG TPA: hypothetical protein VK919_02935 [Solirubrobacterales bacterium]|nr:hypothetical protein [Solirubrobacterales bacterium]